MSLIIRRNPAPVAGRHYVEPGDLEAYDNLDKGPGNQGRDVLEMNTSSDARNPVELLAEEFLDCKRRGERPTLYRWVPAASR